MFTAGDLYKRMPAPRHWELRELQVEMIDASACCRSVKTCSVTELKLRPCVGVKRSSRAKGGRSCSDRNRSGCGQAGAADPAAARVYKLDGRINCGLSRTADAEARARKWKGCWRGLGGKSAAMIDITPPRLRERAPVSVQTGVRPAPEREQGSDGANCVSMSRVRPRCGGGAGAVAGLGREPGEPGRRTADHRRRFRSQERNRRIDRSVSRPDSESGGTAQARIKTNLRGRQTAAHG